MDFWSKNNNNYPLFLFPRLFPNVNNSITKLLYDDYASIFFQKQNYSRSKKTLIWNKYANDAVLTSGFDFNKVTKITQVQRLFPDRKENFSKKLDRLKIFPKTSDFRCLFSALRPHTRLDYQPLFGKGARAPPRTRGGLTGHERAAEIEPSPIQAVCLFINRNMKKCMGILKSLKILNLHRVMIMLKLKINVNLL